MVPEEVLLNIFEYDKLYKLIESPKSFEKIFGISEVELHCKWKEYITRNHLRGISWEITKRQLD